MEQHAVQLLAYTLNVRLVDWRVPLLNVDVSWPVRRMTYIK